MMMNRLVQHILEEYPEVTIHNLTDYFLDNDPQHSAAKLYELSCDDNNFIVIENFDYYKLYSLYNEFMRLKSQTAVLQIHRFVLSNMLLMRGSHFTLLQKTVSNDTIRKTLQTVLAPQSPCSSCGIALRVGIPRLICNSCFVNYCETCSHERWGNNYWCKYCSNHMIYNKIAKPTDDAQLERLNDVIAKK